jgi:hypothetical protein
MHGFRHDLELPYVRIDCDVEQLRLVVRQAPKETVEQRPFLRVLMAGHRAGLFEECPGDAVRFDRCVSAVAAWFIPEGQPGLGCVRFLKLSDGWRQFARERSAGGRLPSAKRPIKLNGLHTK